MNSTPSDTARSILQKKKSTDPDEVLGLVEQLKSERSFDLARRLLEDIADEPAVTGDPKRRLFVAQQRALCTYKDADLQTDAKLASALRILAEADDLRTTRDQETLGLAGAIYKRKWEQTGHEGHLETSLAYYERGFRQGVVTDNGYTAINASYVLDLLSDLERPEVDEGIAATRNARREKARRIRTEIVTRLPALLSTPGNEGLAKQWWFLVTLGEAYFGLSDYPNATLWLGKAAALAPGEVPDWKRESSARQLAQILRIQRRALGVTAADDKGGEVLRAFLGDAAPAADALLRGKMGLGLSGGGFRASLYHIGVLARLAELDLLRHIEYLSCVSGGSILGAHYYLEVRQLLRTKPDGEITREDYIALVQRMEKHFLLGVQRNVRTRIGAEWLTNVKMIFLPDYSRTRRAGELYESEIYSRVEDGEGQRPRWLNELKIIPKGESPTDFRPKDHNWRRQNKVPILVLNATTLNSGHNWQFTASWMGEAPAGIESNVDANYRLRRMYYEEAPPPHNQMRLGYAVAASACVPGIFEPLTLSNLYERTVEGDTRVRPVVRLVDGGVHDNQGTAALLEQDCTVFLVSDASGQMVDQDVPSNGLLGVPLRSNSILQARIRVSQFEELESRRSGGAVKGFMFVHLKKDLETRPVNWIGCDDPLPEGPTTPLTSYGIQKSVQRRLAAVRTDLDSFSEVEAYSLMTSGYLMTERSLRERVLGFDLDQKPPADWKFLKLSPLMADPGPDTALQRQLKVADRLVFKVWLLVRELQVALGVVALAGVISFFYELRRLVGIQLVSLTLGGLLLAVGLTLLSLLGLGLVRKVVDFRKTLQDVVIGFGMATLGFALARLHLHVFDRLFLRQGTLARLLEARGATPPSAISSAPPASPVSADLTSSA